MLIWLSVAMNAVRPAPASNRINPRWESQRPIFFLVNLNFVSIAAVRLMIMIRPIVVPPGKMGNFKLGLMAV